MGVVGRRFEHYRGVAVYMAWVLTFWKGSVTHFQDFFMWTTLNPILKNTRNPVESLCRQCMTKPQPSSLSLLAKSGELSGTAPPFLQSREQELAGSEDIEQLFMMLDYDGGVQLRPAESWGLPTPQVGPESCKAQQRMLPAWGLNLQSQSYKSPEPHTL